MHVHRDLDLFLVPCVKVLTSIANHVSRQPQNQYSYMRDQERHCRQLGDTIDEDDEPPIAEALPAAGDVEDFHRQHMYRTLHQLSHMHELL